MATYKVIQDIEAEDKLLGPLSMRQLIYAAIAVSSIFLAYQLALHVKWFLAVPFLPIIGLFGLLAAPFGHDQSSEIWLLAKVRFLLKPRSRIWDQNGIKQLVTITVPKRVEQRLTNGMDQSEVASRLQALASTLDSRGWAIKNAAVNLASQPSYIGQASSDRLVAPSSMPQDVPSIDINASDDILDAASNATAQHLDQLINASAQDHKQRVVEQLQNPHAAQQLPSKDSPWFMDSSKITNSAKSVTKKAKGAKDKLKESVKHRAAKPKTSTTPSVDPVILELANRNDFDVATLSRQAQKDHGQSTDGEVIVPLR